MKFTVSTLAAAAAMTSAPLAARGQGFGDDVGSGSTADAANVGASKTGDCGDIKQSRVVLTLSKAL